MLHIYIPVWITSNKLMMTTMLQAFQEAGENTALPFSRCSLKQIQASSPSTKSMYSSLQCNLCSREAIHSLSSLCPDFCAVGSTEILNHSTQNCSWLPCSAPTQVQDSTAKSLSLPRFQWPLVCYRPDLFPDNRQFGGVNHFGVSVAVSEFQGAIPFSLCLAHNGVCWIVLYFGCNPDSRGTTQK